VLRAVLRSDQDAFGSLLIDLAAGGRVVKVVERDDGCVFTGDARYYLAPGNNLDLLAGEHQGRRLLRRLAQLATGEGRILAGSYDPYHKASELALRYHARNRARGKLGGVERVRVRYREYATLVRRALRVTR
jgi:glyoxylase-like metal-dependent hydrolase (beta-lactamase superfamily II)